MDNRVRSSSLRERAVLSLCAVLLPFLPAAHAHRAAATRALHAAKQGGRDRVVAAPDAATP
jgi:hypothetical protein